MVRIFGAGTEEIIDRQEELQRLRKLNCEGFGAKVLGTFGNGRLEEFLEGRIIEVEEMQQPETQKLVARRMANFHALMHVAASPECTLWTTLAKWYECCSSNPRHSPEKTLCRQCLATAPLAWAVPSLGLPNSKVFSPTMHSSPLLSIIIIVRRHHHHHGHHHHPNCSSCSWT